MGDIFYPKSVDLLEKVMDLRQMRHELIASNIANANTPGYRSKDISFEKQLMSAVSTGDAGLMRTHKNHLPQSAEFSSIRPEMITPAYKNINNDLNSVDMDAELMKLSRNNVLYDAMVRILRKKMEGIEYAIREGGK